MYNIPFTKMHGLGNDYIYINCIDRCIDDPQSLSVEISDRHKGVGADGIVLILKSECADFKMKMYNSDGSEGDMCGNACRCIARYVYDKNLTDKTHISIETNAGIKYATVNVENDKVIDVTVDMGKANFSPESVPANSDTEIIGMPITINDSIYKITALSVGNPHCVIFTDDINRISFAGPQLENHNLFPSKVNVELAERNSVDTTNVRVWERGSGETMSCGTGACAVAVAAKRLFNAPDRQTICMPGGNLKIYLNPENEHIYLTGEAEFVFEGIYNRRSI